MSRATFPSFRRARAIGLAAAAAAATTMIFSASASAATLTVDDDGDQCPTATFTTIQAAVNAAVGGTDDIHVCNGIYVEQLDVDKQVTIDGDGAGTVIYSPDTLATKFTTGGNPNKPVVYVHDTDGTVIQDVTVDGAGKGNANNRIQGIAYHQAGGTVQDTRIEDVRNTPFDGVQAGVAFYALADNGTDRTVTLDDSQLIRFQKNGTVFTGVDLTVNATDNTVTGAGPTTLTAQNGFQLSGGAGGTISGNTVTGIDYTPRTTCSTGVLLFGPATGGVVTNNTITNSMCSLYSQDSSGAQMNGNTITGSVFAVTLFSNPATINGNRIVGTGETGGTGIYADESGGTANVTYTANGNSVTGYTDGVGIQVADFDTGNLFTATMNAAFNRVAGNETGASADDATLNGENNWWGCNEGPGQPGCDPVATTGTGAADVDPRLVLGLAANPATIAAGGGTSQISANLTRNSTGAVVGPGFPNGTSIAFGTTLGSIGAAAMTANGVATTTLTAGSQSGVANVAGTLDNESPVAQVTITPQAAGGTAGEVGGTAKKKKCKKKKYRKKHPKKCKKKK